MAPQSVGVPGTAAFQRPLRQPASPGATRHSRRLVLKLQRMIERVRELGGVVEPALTPVTTHVVVRASEAAQCAARKLQACPPGRWVGRSYLGRCANSGWPGGCSCSCGGWACGASPTCCARLQSCEMIRG